MTSTIRQMLYPCGAPPTRRDPDTAHGACRHAAMHAAVAAQRATTARSRRGSVGGLWFATLLQLSSGCAMAVDTDAAHALLVNSNRLRETAGLQALREEPRLASAARRYAEFMATTDRYGHEADGRQPVQRAQGQGY